VQRPLAVLFDMGETIFTRPEYDEATAIGMFCNEFGLLERASEEEIARVFRTVSQDTYERSCKSLIEFPFDNLCRLVCAQFGLKVKVSKRFMDHYFESVYRRAVLTPGYACSIARLRQLGIRLGVLSDSFFYGNTLERSFAKAGILREFSFVMSSADIGVRKPHTLLFKAAAVRIGIPEKHIWYVGDSVERDVRGARSSGMHAVWYNATRSVAPRQVECTVVSNWRQFLDLLER